MRISSTPFRFIAAIVVCVKITVFALAAAVALSGCASVQQALNGYESAASVSIDTANDNAVKVWSYQACQTPVSAALRNPAVIPAIKALCMPASSTPAASTLLDAAATTQPGAKS